VIIPPILQKTEEQLHRAEKSMRSASSYALLNLSESLKDVALKDFEILQISSIPYQLIADVLDGIIRAANHSFNSKVKIPIVGGKFKVECRTIQIAKPLIYPFTRSIGYLSYSRNIDSFDLFTITNIDNYKVVRVNQGVILMIRLGFLAKGSFALQPQEVIECLELHNPKKYQILNQEVLVDHGALDYTELAFFTAKKYGKNRFEINPNTFGCYLPYLNYQLYVGAGKTVGQFVAEKEELLEGTQLQLKEDYAVENELEIEEVTDELLSQVLLEKDAGEEDQFLHLFVGENRLQRITEIQGLKVPFNVSITVADVYIFERKKLTCAFISPQVSVPKRVYGKRDKDKLDTQDTSMGLKNVVRYGGHSEKTDLSQIYSQMRAKITRARLRYCLFLPLTEEAKAAALKDAEGFVKIDNEACIYRLPYKNYGIPPISDGDMEDISDTAEFVEDREFLHVFNQRVRDENMKLVQYDFDEPVRDIGIYVFEIYTIKV
jgi:hypothetical protein